jgi:heterodisulfide reductase subunit A-like polyferredoxin
MPAFSEEIDHAISEGIDLIPDSYVAHPRPLPSGGEVSPQRGDGRGALRFDLNTFSTKNPLQTIEADHVIVAIGQETETEALGDIELDSSDRVKADERTGRTDRENVFVAGDLCAENHMSVIGAIASGKRAATGVRQLLEGYQYDYEGAEALHKLNSDSSNVHLPMTEEWDGQLLKDITRFDLFQACQKCNHCIDNFGCPALVKINGKIELDEPKCTHCGLCIDVCPNGAIQWQDQPTNSETTNSILQMTNKTQ